MRNKSVHIKVNRFSLFLFNNRKQRGFTLIELIIYGGMLSILLGVFVTLFGSIVDAQLDSQATSSVQQDGQFIMTKLSHDIMNASSISIPQSVGATTQTLQISRDATSFT